MKEFFKMGYYMFTFKRNILPSRTLAIFLGVFGWMGLIMFFYSSIMLIILLLNK